MTALLQIFNLSTLSSQEKIPFFLNLYNALVIHGYIEYGLPRKIISRLQFYQTVSYKIGSDIFSLEDMEHGVLRCNRKSPVPFFLNPQFSPKDPKLQFTLPEADFDPRIHFALVCGAKSCPPIRIFSTSNLNKGLHLAARLFCNDDSNVKISEKNRLVELSEIFKWYETDFGSNKFSMLSFLHQFLEEPKSSSLNQLLLTFNKHDVHISYLPYNWDLNGKLWKFNIVSTD